jgi:DNA-binding transcriptional LysR family regulator
VFAAKSYIARRGAPREPSELIAHEIVGMDRGTQIIEGFARAGFTVDRDWFRVRCDDQVTQWELVRAGCGIGFAQRIVGCRDPLVVELPLELGLPRLPVWLTAHTAIRQTPRVARVWELLAEGLRETLHGAVRSSVVAGEV